MVELRELSIDDGQKVYDMLQDIGQEENGFQNKVKGLTYEKFKEYLKTNLDHSKGINLPEDYVPQTIYWAYDQERPVGMAKLRHYLNDKLKKEGGHASYAVRESERKKGYGKVILKELIKKAKAQGLKEILLTCEDDNTASRKIIEANGGKLDKIIDDECLYWIKDI